MTKSAAKLATVDSIANTPAEASACVFFSHRSRSHEFFFSERVFDGDPVVLEHEEITSGHFQLVTVRVRRGECPFRYAAIAADKVITVAESPIRKPFKKPGYAVSDPFFAFETPAPARGGIHSLW